MYSKEKLFKEIEVSLANHKVFANSFHIIKRTLSFYHLGLKLLTKNIPAAKILLKNLDQANEERYYRLLGDPVIRHIIHYGIEHLNDSSTHSCDQVQTLLDATIPFLIENKGTSPLEAPAKPTLHLGKGIYSPWIWKEERPVEIFGQYFRNLFSEKIATRASNNLTILSTPNKNMQDILVKGNEVLNELLPMLSKSIIPHVHVIAMIDVINDVQDKEKETRDHLEDNISTPAFPATIFLSTSSLRNPWVAAEAILHESLHQKYFDIAFTNSIFNLLDQDTNSPKIRALWNTDLFWNQNDWSIQRALGAFHVYVHLAFFFLILEYCGKKLPWIHDFPLLIDPLTKGSIAFERAQYLGKQLQQYKFETLGHNGRVFLEWLFYNLNKIKTLL